MASEVSIGQGKTDSRKRTFIVTLPPTNPKRPTLVMERSLQKQPMPILPVPGRNPNSVYQQLAKKSQSSPAPVKQKPKISDVTNKAQHFPAAPAKQQQKTPAVRQDACANSDSLKDLCIISTGKRLLDACKKGNAAEVKELIDVGAPFIADWVGTSPLHFSVMNKHVEVTELLLQAGICRDAKNKVNRTPLHIAASMKLSYMVKLLLTFGADVNCKDLMKMTPLHWAAEKADSLTAKILLDYGADVNAENVFDLTPYEAALKKGNVDVAQTIVAAESLHPDMRSNKAALLKQKVAVFCRSLKPVAEILEPADAAVKLPSTFGLDSAESSQVVMFAKQSANEDGEVRGALFIDENEVEEEKKESSAEQLSKDSAINLLKSHGVTMDEPDAGTVIDSAILNGHTIRLTDAGKLAFKNLDQNPKKLIKPVSARLNDEFPKRTPSAVPTAAEEDPIPADPTLDPEKSALYLERLSKKANECRRQVAVLRKQARAKELELIEVTKQIDLFRSLCVPKFN